ncbi:hypothetical protein [Candidatus Formimonas warabiya]|nr:hypothetical protein [Candidatus Formimonas warabiya]
MLCVEILWKYIEVYQALSSFKRFLNGLVAEEIVAGLDKSAQGSHL